MYIKDLLKFHKPEIKRLNISHQSPLSITTIDMIVILLKSISPTFNTFFNFIYL